MKETEKELRDRFNQLWEQHFRGSDIQYADEVVADFWLKELDSYTNKKLEEVREKIEKAETAEDKVGSFKDGYDCFKAQVISLLSNK